MTHCVLRIHISACLNEEIKEIHDVIIFTEGLIRSSNDRRAATLSHEDNKGNIQGKMGYKMLLKF